MPKTVEVIREFHQHLKQDSKFLVLCGGARSGKSYAIAQFIILHLMPQHDKEILVARKVNRTLKLSAWKLVRTLLKDYGIPFSENKSDQCIEFNGNIIWFSGLDDPEKIKSTEFNYIWMEEATEFDREDFLQLSMRLSRRTKEKNQMFFSFNPVSKANWVYRTFFETEHEDTNIMFSNYTMNRHLSDDYRQILEDLKEQDEAHYKVYGLGEFADFTNIIYTNWKVSSEIPEEFDEKIYGLDFGFNNPSVLLHLGLRDEIVYITDEVYQTKLTNAELINVLKDEKVKGAIYADSAEPQRIEEIARARFNVYPADKRVLDGIDSVKRHKIIVHPRCVKTIEEFQGYSWKKNRNDEILDEPVKFNDHAMDALRYAVYTHKKAERRVLIGRA